MSGNTLRVVAAFAVLAALGACDSVKQVTNLVTNTGNDQSLDTLDDNVKRPPLTLPPDFNLRPPSSANAAGATDFTAAQQARQTVFGLGQDKEAGAPIERKSGRTPGEAALLQHAGAGELAPGIRKKVDRQSDTLARDEKTFVNNLLKPSAEQAPAKPGDSGWFGGLASESNKPTIERAGGGIFGNLF